MSLGGALVGTVFRLMVIRELIPTAPLFADSWCVENVLLAIFAIGGMIGLMIRAGAVQGILEALADRADSADDAEKAAFLAGIAIHIDDYFNCLVVGSMMRPLTDRFDVSRAKAGVLRRQRRFSRLPTGLLLDVGRGDDRIHRRRA